MASKNFTEILLRKGIVSLDQLSEAERMARETNKKPADCLVFRERLDVPLGQLLRIKRDRNRDVMTTFNDRQSGGCSISFQRVSD